MRDTPLPNARARALRARRANTGRDRMMPLLLQSSREWPYAAAPAAGWEGDGGNINSISWCKLTGEPWAPSCRRTFTMSTGWMTEVANMPLRPPFKNGLIASQMLLVGLASDIFADAVEDLELVLLACKESRQKREI